MVVNAIVTVNTLAWISVGMMVCQLGCLMVISMTQMRENAANLTHPENLKNLGKIHTPQRWKKNDGKKQQNLFP